MSTRREGRKEGREGGERGRNFVICIGLDVSGEKFIKVLVDHIKMRGREGGKERKNRAIGRILSNFSEAQNITHWLRTPHTGAAHWKCHSASLVFPQPPPSLHHMPPFP